MIQQHKKIKVNWAQVQEILLVFIARNMLHPTFDKDKRNRVFLLN